MLKSIIWYAKFIITLVLKTPQLKKANKILKTEGQEAFDEYVYNITNQWALKRLKDSKADIIIHGNEKIPQDTNV